MKCGEDRLDNKQKPAFNFTFRKHDLCNDKRKIKQILQPSIKLLRP